MQPEDVEFRLATADDYEAVMDIDRNIYSGYDYLPTMYHSYVNNPQRVVCVAQLKGQIVSNHLFIIFVLKQHCLPDST